jgi:CRISPR/Cas system-associated exonuclease Cas4 (RecB family)
LQQISRWGSKSFLSIEQLDSFSFDGVQIFAIPDFALYNQEYMLYDWKTGKPNDNNRLQLSLYIFYAMAKYKATKGQIKIIPVYLTQDDVSFEPIQPLDIDTVKNYIRDSIKDMKDVLSDVENNTADIENFPLTADLWKCHSCKFKELCDR